MAQPSLIASLILLLLAFNYDGVCEARHGHRNGGHGHGHGQGVGIYVLKRGDFTAQFTNYGATMLSVVFPDKNGILGDIVLQYEKLVDYQNDTSYFGGLVGRVANRIGNAEFTLNGVHYKLPANNGNNTLHGGNVGFNDVLWDVESYETNSHVTFTYWSHDGEQGFPGTLGVWVTYKLVGKNTLQVEMSAKAYDDATPVNLALHTYWNLGGHNSGDILSHKIQLFASKITPVNDQLIPTGEIKDIRGTPYDFLKPRPIGSRIKEIPGGYDINYVVDGKADQLKKVAVVEESVSGRKMELWSNQAGVQFYTAGMLDDTKGKDGALYTKFSGFALETQGFPDSVNNRNFPSQIVEHFGVYNHIMLYKFSA